MITNKQQNYQMEEENEFINSFVDKNEERESTELLKAKRKLKKILCGQSLIVYQECNQNASGGQPQVVDQPEKVIFPKINQSNPNNILTRGRSYQKSQRQIKNIQSHSHQNEEEASLTRTRSQAAEKINSMRSKKLIQRLNDIREDILSHPLKYKIAAQTMGIDPEKIYALNEQELARIKELYLREKGRQNLKYARSHGKPEFTRSSTSTNQNQIRRPPSPARSRSYIRELFKDVAEKRQRKIEKQREKEQRKAKINAKVAKLNEQQWTLGRVVYDKVRKHVQTEQSSSDFCGRVSSEQMIDDALIKFLKAKIKRAETVLQVPSK